MNVTVSTFQRHEIYSLILQLKKSRFRYWFWSLKRIGCRFHSMFKTSSQGIFVMTLILLCFLCLPCNASALVWLDGLGFYKQNNEVLRTQLHWKVGQILREIEVTIGNEVTKIIFKNHWEWYLGNAWISWVTKKERLMGFILSNIRDSLFLVVRLNMT